MRKKAENKIRQAAAKLGQSELYRIDKVRGKSGIIKKVFDKTILDMARVGSIELSSGSTDGMSSSEIGNLIRDGDELHVHFKFMDEQTEAKVLQPEKTSAENAAYEEVDIVLLEVEPAMWQRFKHQCLTREDKDPVEKLREMIRDYTSIR